jgi:hypothetical protein
MVNTSEYDNNKTNYIQDNSGQLRIYKNSMAFGRNTLGKVKEGQEQRMRQT